MGLNYAAMQTAIQAGIVAASGLATDLVRWEGRTYQGVPRPVGERFITMQIGPSVKRGIDGYTTTYSADRPAGQEIEIATIGVQECRLYLQCFGGTATGNTSAYATLDRVRERLSLPSVRAVFLAAGIAPFAPGAVTHLPNYEGTKFESRATLEIRCNVDASESDYVGLIQHVEVGQTIGGTYIGTFQVDTGD